jgi:hypothetical protein
LQLEASLGKQFTRPCLEKNPITKEGWGLVEWLKVSALSSSPSTAKPNQTKQNKTTSSTVLSFLLYSLAQKNLPHYGSSLLLNSCAWHSRLSALTPTLY